MRIAIFGGTFNPIHKGHMFLARQAKRALNLDKIIFVPAYIPPHKKSNDIIDARQRLRMIELAISGRACFDISKYEIDKKEKVYSIQTVRHFKRFFPRGTELFFLIGADSLKGLDKWKESHKLFDLCEFAVFSRPGFKLSGFQSKFCISKIKIDALDISSTQVREFINQGKSISRLVPKPVKDYINRKGLYRTRVIKTVS
jgi:nicotinate-nucleotide adenylyltransferase